MTSKSEEFDFDKALKALRAGKPLSGKKWTMPIQNWSLTISLLAIYFEGGLDKASKI